MLCIGAKIEAETTKIKDDFHILKQINRSKNAGFELNSLWVFRRNQKFITLEVSLVIIRYYSMNCATFIQALDIFNDHSSKLEQDLLEPIIEVNCQGRPF